MIMSEKYMNCACVKRPRLDISTQLSVLVIFTLMYVISGCVSLILKYLQIVVLYHSCLSGVPMIIVSST